MGDVDSGSRLRVLVAEDHTLVRDGLKRMIGDQPDMVVVGEATSGDEVVAEANRLSPSIVLVDISMPGADGITVAQRLTATCPGARIIAVTRHTDAVFVTRMLRAGAAGYVLKQSPSAELLRAMRAVADGEQYVDAALRVTHAADVPRTTAPSSPDAAREQ
jgi:DNA-binding NarL/FixJ family response regulator